MTLLVVGLALFFATHVFTSMRGLRAGAINALGPMGYRGLYSIAALAGFVLIVMGWMERPFIPIWYPPVWAQHIALTLMLPAMILLVAAYTPSGKIKPAVQHPMLAAIKIWAFSHLLANGDLASILLFGVFLAYAVFNRIAVKRRADAVPPTPGPIAYDLVPVLVGSGVYVAFLFWLHQMLIGVPVLP